MMNSSSPSPSSTAAPAYKLYGRKGTGSFAIQAALEELGVSYDRIWIGTAAEEISAYKLICPTGKVPALGLPDGTLLMESAAMLIHLSAAHPEACLAPLPGTTRHAVFLQWMVFMSANVYEAALRVYYSHRYTAQTDEAAVAAVKVVGLSDMLRHLETVGAALSPFVLGADYSVADIYLHMLVSWVPAEKAAELHARVPKLAAHAAAVAARPSIVKVAADHVE